MAPERAPSGLRWKVAAVAGAALATGAALLFAPGLEASTTRQAGDAGGGSLAHFEETLDVQVFQRGNLHAHSLLSDGDSSPENVFAWYRDHGYQFLALTDHDSYMNPADYPDETGPGFALIPGEEVTLRAGAAGVPIHVNGLCTSGAVGDAGPFPTAGEALAWASARIRERGGIVLINHPNYRWAFGADEIAATRGAHLLEIFSRHPGVKSGGDQDHPSEEALWQDVLDRGDALGAVAVDDMHSLGVVPNMYPRAGRAWVEVFARETTQEAICDALRAGRLYASSGLPLARIQVGGESMSVWVGEPNVTVDFVGRGGRVLESVTARVPSLPSEGLLPRATYRLRGQEELVRARLTAADGEQAWTQAYRVVRPTPRT